MEFRKVKGVTKKYTSKKTNITKETIIKSVYLGSESEFDVNDEVVVLSKDEYEKQNESSNEISILKDEILQLTKELSDLKEAKSNEVDKTKNIIIKLEEDLRIQANEMKYLEEVIHEYEKQNLIQRLLNKNPKKYVEIQKYNLIETSKNDE